MRLHEEAGARRAAVVTPFLQNREALLSPLRRRTLTRKASREYAKRPQLRATMTHPAIQSQKKMILDRRQFLGTAAMAIVATQLGMIGCANEQSSET